MSTFALAVFNSGIAAETPQKSEWVGNKLGTEALSGDYTEPGTGFIPLQCSGNAVITDFKRILFNEFALPSAIFVRDEKVLSNETSLRIDTRKGQLKFHDEKLKIALNGKNSVAGNSVFGNDTLNVEIKFQVDFDYIFKYEITLNPKEKQVLTKASLVFALNLPTDKLCALHKEGPNRLEAGIEAEKRRIFLNVKDGEKVAPGFCPNFWVGNTSYGISCNFTDARNWTGPKGQELIFDPQKNELNINFINTATEIDKPVTFNFYFGITPIKRMPKNWRAWNFATQLGNDPIDPKYDKLVYWSFWRISNQETFNNQWVTSPEKLRKLAAQDNAMPNRSLMHYMLPSLTTHTIVTEKEGKTYVMEDKYLRYAAEKNARIPSVTPTKINIPDDAIYFKNIEERNSVLGQNACPAKSITQDITPDDDFIDYLTWGVNQFAGNYRIGGVYSDGICPAHNYRYGYRDASGAETPYYAFDAYRRLYKRIRHIVRSNNPNELMMAHSSGNRPVPVMSLFDVTLFGENFFYWYHEPEKRDASGNGDFYYAHIFGDIDNLKTEFFSRQWGMPQVFLPELRGRDRKVFPNPTRGTRTMLAYTLQFDLLYWPLWCDAGEVHKWNQIRFNFGMNDTPLEIVDFVPYWENKVFKSTDDKVKIGYYEKIQQHDPDVAFNPSKKYLLIISNLQFADSKFTVSLPEKLTVPKAVEVQNNKQQEVRDRKIEISLAPYDFATVEITGEME
ncbi:MAG: glycoside hydrolase domain-containing protein [Victivallales bacterium]